MDKNCGKFYMGGPYWPPPHILPISFHNRATPVNRDFFLFPVLLLKVAKVNFRKSQAESARNDF